MTDKTPWTPGPWEKILLDTDGRMFDRGKFRVMRGAYFGDAIQATAHDTGNDVIALVPGCDADNSGNTNLIAVAPEMDEVLGRLEYWFDTDREVLDAMGDDERRNHLEMLAMIRAVRAKARGEQ